MNEVKRYYKLDEIGFVGVQEKTIDERGSDITKTIQFIKLTQKTKGSGFPAKLPEKRTVSK